MIQEHLQECIKLFEGQGDAAAQSEDLNQAIQRYSSALSLNPRNRVGLLVKRSKAWGMLEKWEDALKDADDVRPCSPWSLEDPECNHVQAIKIDSLSPLVYETRHTALHALQRYDEAVDALSHIFSLIGRPDPYTDRECRLQYPRGKHHDADYTGSGKTFVSPALSEPLIESVVRGVFKTSPLVLIDVKSGFLCDGPERIRTFKSESQFKALVSSMPRTSDNEQIHRVVGQYFQYVTLSHVWRGKEPLYEDVSAAGSAWKLDSSAPPNEKLRKFCEVVRGDGYRWAWSDTCCIDKTISTLLNQSLMMMYKWYEASAATFVHLADVDSPSALGDLTKSFWMKRAWTAQELLAGKVIRFYDRDWKPYLGDTRTNHKESQEIMQELADVIGIAREMIISFNPDHLTIRQKLRLASTRNATVDEDVAYSLIGIFRSDIRPYYGEGDAALGHLLEEIVTRSGDITVLAWTGKSSSYNSCFPATLAVYSQTTRNLPAIEAAEMDKRAAALRTSLSQTDATSFHDRITQLPPARSASRRLRLPCIIFSVKRLWMKDFESDREYRYRARVPGVGDVDFQTSDQLSLSEPDRLVLVHPWMRNLRDPLDEFTWGRTADDHSDEYESDTEGETEAESTSPSPLDDVLPVATVDTYARALRLIVRLQQPFPVLLLQHQPNGEFKRVATDHEIVVPGIKRSVNLAKDVRADVVEIL